MIFDAIVLAGGRASRLGGVSKPELLVDGRSLLSLALAAASGARRVVVVGPAAVPAGVLVTQEDPPFGGPAAAIAAGINAIAPETPADFVLVLAADLPNSAAAVVELLGRASEGADGVVATDDSGRRQPLLGLYRAGPLTEAVLAQGPGIRNLSVRALLSPLDLVEVTVPDGTTDDIDTWADAAGFGISPPSPTEGHLMNERDADATLAALTDWSDRLTAALGIEGAVVDIDAVLALAGTVAHAVMRPAAPLTTYLVGYAAGVAAAERSGSGFTNAAAIATALAAGSGDATAARPAESGDR
ncbi:MAG: NTP transferase domain-containing protein [Actinomycetota bacterium]